MSKIEGTFFVPVVQFVEEPGDEYPLWGCLSEQKGLATAAAQWHIDNLPPNVKEKIVRVQEITITSVKGPAPITFSDLHGITTLTDIVIPATGRPLVFKGSWLTDARSNEILKYPSVVKDLRRSKSGGRIFQASQARGTGLVDETGKVY